MEPETKLRVVSKWIDRDETKNDDLPIEDVLSGFFKFQVYNEIDTLPLIMGLSYLSQFEDLSGEFAKRPVYAPDFVVVDVPYSTQIIDDLNLVRKHGDLTMRDGTHLKYSLRTSEYNEVDINADCEIDSFLFEKDQFARLAIKNVEIFNKYDSERKLFKAVRDCYKMNQKIANNIVI